MKKIILSIAALFLCILGLIAGRLLFFHHQIPYLDSNEQQKIKEGKLFWEWDSSYGPLTLHYLEKGTGSKHILFLHGFRSHSYTWKNLIDPLAELGYHVWAIDFIGYGLSDKPSEPSYQADFFVDQIHSFMKAKGIEKVHLVGNSMGGGLALSFAITHGESVHSLTLLNALGFPLDLPAYHIVGKYLNRIWRLIVGPHLVRYGLEKIIHRKEIITDEKVEAYFLPYRFPGGMEASYATLKSFNNQQLIEMGNAYPLLSHPMLVIWGDHDWLIPLSHFEKFLKQFPHSESLLIAECGHIPQEEAPHEVLKTMVPFLKKAS